MWMELVVIGLTTMWVLVVIAIWTALYDPRQRADYPTDGPGVGTRSDEPGNHDRR